MLALGLHWHCRKQDICFTICISAALPDCRTQIHKWISIWSMRTRSAPHSPIYLRQVTILLAKTGNTIAFASARALNGCHPRIPSRSTGTAPRRPPAASQYPSHIHPSGEHPHQAMGYLAQESPPPFPGNLGHSPKKLQTGHKTRQPSKPELLFNRAAHCSTNSLVLRSSFQEAGDIHNIPDLTPITQTWQKHFFWATERPPLPFSLKQFSVGQCCEAMYTPCVLNLCQPMLLLLENEG